MKSKKFTMLIVVVCAIFILALLLSLMLSEQQISDYTEKQHIERISELAKERYLNEGSDFTGCNVFPLYDENEEFTYYCVIELEPVGYVYVAIRNVVFWARVFGSNGMYSRCQLEECQPWQRYRIHKNDESAVSVEGRLWVQKDVGSNIIYEADESGKIIDYTNSHYKVAEIDGEKRYLLRCGDCYVPAVKRENKFLNLISMEVFTYDITISSEEIPSMGLDSLPKKICDL